MTTSILCFSGDPITAGHIDIIERGLQLFDHVIVAIGVNPKKNYTFSLEDRKQMAKRVLSKFGDRVSVDSFEGLVSDFAFKNNVRYIIRGIRSVVDFDYEKTMAEINRTQGGIETIPLFSKPEFDKISSSTVKELVSNQGDITGYVPLYVKQKLERCFGQTIIGITGEIGAGKSYVCNKLCVPTGLYGESAYNIDLDEIARDILQSNKNPFAIAMRSALIESFGDSLGFDILKNNTDNFIDPFKIGDIIFNNPGLRNLYNDIVRDPILYEMKQRMFGKQGIIFISSALLVEADLLSYVNNNVILITADYEIRKERLLKRGYSSESIENRMSAQLDASAKEGAIRGKIAKDQYGSLTIYKNDCPDEDCLGKIDRMLYQNMEF
jgi:pantetheine-phosphate adenylyltransferase